MRESGCPLLLLILNIFVAAQIATAQVTSGQINSAQLPGNQAGPTLLQPGVPIERTLAAGQAHSYNISLDRDQFLQLVVDQHGIDVVVRVFLPNGKRLGEFDSPNGTEGPENVSLVSDAPGIYRIEVAPLGQFENPSPGRYVIRIEELRKATDEELRAGKNKEAAKAKGVALLIEAAQTLPELRSPRARADFQIRAAQLLWATDEKRATKLAEQAIESVKGFIAAVDESEPDYWGSYQTAYQLRQKIVEVLAPHDPEMALNFLRATRTLANPAQGRGQENPEQQLELSLVNQIAANDPKRAFQMAEDALKNTPTNGLIETLRLLRAKDAELGAKLAHDLATKLTNESLLKNPPIAYLATSFLFFVRSTGRPQMGDGAVSQSLISEDEYRDLFQKVISEALGYSPPAENVYSPEREAARSLLNMLKQMSANVQSYAPDRAAAIDKKWTELNNQGDVGAWQKYQTAINSGPPDAALETINQAPREMKEQLYQQLANRIAAAGDVARARQVITDNIANSMQRQQALRQLDQQSIYSAMAKGRVEDALRILSGFRPANERAAILSQLVMQIGPGLKRATALLYLEQARNMLGPSARADDQFAMQALFEISRAFARYDSNRAFEIIEPLIDQFDELSVSAGTMNGFGQKYFQDGELITYNGNVLAEVANRLATALGSLAVTSFDRARMAADRIHLVDVRMNVYLTIAQQTIQGDRNPGQE